MSRCWHCGGEIEFRYIDGKLTPIHLSGGWCQGDSGASQCTRVEVTPSERRFEDVCHTTTCPQCGQSVFYLTHNGGSVWVDELGWPWPKHACFDHRPVPRWLSYFKKEQEHQARRKGTFGVVQKARWVPRKGHLSTHIAMAIDAGKRGRLCIATTGTNTADYLLGRVVSFDLNDASMITSNHEVRSILRVKIPPALLDLPDHWPSVSYPESFKAYPTDDSRETRDKRDVNSEQTREERLLKRIEELLRSPIPKDRRNRNPGRPDWVCTELRMQFGKLERLSPKSISFDLRRRVHEFMRTHCDSRN